MSIELTSLSQLTPEQVQSQLDVIAALLQEDNPTLDLRRGVLHDVLAYYHAALTAKDREDLDRYNKSASLLLVEQDPSLADDGVVDAILSNWRLTRGEGTAAKGEITIVLNAANPVTIGAGTVFTANGQTFTADQSYTAKESSALINNDSDRLLTQLSDTQWAFTINVTATQNGTASLLTKDTLAIPSSLPLGYVSSYATDDFADGLDSEDNTQLLNRLEQGVSAVAPSNRITMAAVLRSQAAFSRIVNQSIIGYGDEEMLRDKHTIFPVALGGRADWYIRTQERVELQTLTKTCTLVHVNNDGTGLWQASISRDDAPGFYEVAFVRLPDMTNVTGGFNIESDVRDMNLSSSGFVPDIQNAVECAYSRFQTAVIQFTDTVTDHSALEAGATADYNVTVRMLPQIGDIQDYISSFDVRPYGSDVLIKAPVPCFVQLSFVIAKKRTQDDPDVQGIKDALASLVNNLDFLGSIYAGQLQDVIHGFLTGGMSVGALDMHGRIRLPDGTTQYVRSESVLTVPSVEGLMTSTRTVQFFLDPEDIAVSVSTDVPVPN